MMEKSTYLARIPSEVYDRSYERFVVNKPGTVYAIGPNLTGMRRWPVTVVDLSVAGAGLHFGTTIGLPLHYYLTFLGFPYRVGCAEAHRQDGRVGVKFISPIDTGVIRQIIRADFRAGGVNISSSVSRSPQRTSP